MQAPFSIYALIQRPCIQTKIMVSINTNHVSTHRSISQVSPQTSPLNPAQKIISQASSSQAQPQMPPITPNPLQGEGTPQRALLIHPSRTGQPARNPCARASLARKQPMNIKLLVEHATKVGVARRQRAADGRWRQAQPIHPSIHPAYPHKVHRVR